MTRRKVCVVVNSRANYGRIKSFMRAALEHPGLELQLIAGASAPFTDLVRRSTSCEGMASSRMPLFTQLSRERHRLPWPSRWGSPPLSLRPSCRRWHLTSF